MELKSNEIVESIKGYEGLYAITTLGRVWSYRRKIWLASFLTGNGYPTVKLSCDGYSEDRKVHRLVAEAFIDNHDNKPQVNHLNGNKTDNRVTNLEWATSRENHQHAYDLGLNRNFKLSYAQKLQACNLYYNHRLKQNKIASMLGVSAPAISYIVKNYGNIAETTH